MHRLIGQIIAITLTIAAPAAADGDRPGVFDYYVMSLSWSPNWCLREGNARKSVQCNPDRNHGWILHGLWPQYARGYPAFCGGIERPPSRSMTAGMSDIMGTAGLAWHQWKKHGTCTGLSAPAYFRLSRQAYGSVTRPEIFRKLTRTVRLPAAVVEDAFLKANPDIRPDGITITCRKGQIHETRICLTRALSPRRCGPDVIRDCQLDKALFAPSR